MVVPTRVATSTFFSSALTISVSIAAVATLTSNVTVSPRAILFDCREGYFRFALKYQVAGAHGAGGLLDCRHGRSPGLSPALAFCLPLRCCCGHRARIGCRQVLGSVRRRRHDNRGEALGGARLSQQCRLQLEVGPDHARCTRGDPFHRCNAARIFTKAKPGPAALVMNDLAEPP